MAEDHLPDPSLARIGSSSEEVQQAEPTAFHSDGLTLSWGVACLMFYLHNGTQESCCWGVLSVDHGNDLSEDCCLFLVTIPKEY